MIRCSFLLLTLMLSIFMVEFSGRLNLFYRHVYMGLMMLLLGPPSGMIFLILVAWFIKPGLYMEMSMLFSVMQTTWEVFLLMILLRMISKIDWLRPICRRSGLLKLNLPGLIIKWVIKGVFSKIDRCFINESWKSVLPYSLKNIFYCLNGSKAILFVEIVIRPSH